MTDLEKNTYQSFPPLERAEFFQRLIEEKNYTKSSIAKKIGKSLAYVSNTLRLLHLPDFIKEGLLTGEISEGHARALLSCKNEEDTIKIYRDILLKKLSVRKTEERVRKSNQFSSNKSGV